MKNAEPQSAFAGYRLMIEATDGLTLRQVCAITGLEPSTIQNWIKRGFVASPVQKKYRERQLARILLISVLRESMQIDSIGTLMTYVNGNTEDESDDIISEADLYDRFSAVTKDLKDDLSGIKDIPARVAREKQEYDAPDQNAAERLGNALTVMAYACAAAFCKEKSENLFETIKKENVK